MHDCLVVARGSYVVSRSEKEGSIFLFFKERGERVGERGRKLSNEMVFVFWRVVKVVDLSHWLDFDQGVS